MHTVGVFTAYLASLLLELIEFITQFRHTFTDVPNEPHICLNVV